jgi:hypothetical protein
MAKDSRLFVYPIVLEKLDYEPLFAGNHFMGAIEVNAAFEQVASTINGRVEQLFRSGNWGRFDDTPGDEMLEYDKAMYNALVSFSGSAFYGGKLVTPRVLTQAIFPANLFGQPVFVRGEQRTALADLLDRKVKNGEQFVSSEGVLTYLSTNLEIDRGNNYLRLK